MRMTGSLRCKYMWHSDVVRSQFCYLNFHILTLTDKQTKYLNNHLTNRPTKQINNHRASSSSWEAKSLKASEQTPRILWSPKVRYYDQDSLPLLTKLSQINPVHALHINLFKIHSNIILPCTTTYSKCVFLSGLHTRTHSLLPTRRMHCQFLFPRIRHWCSTGGEHKS